jgi:hypothetical protein
MKKLLLLSLALVVVSCSSPGVEKIPNTSVYQICIEGTDIVYFRCDQDGNILTNSMSTSVKTGKRSVSFIE